MLARSREAAGRAKLPRQAPHRQHRCSTFHTLWKQAGPSFNLPALSHGPRSQNQPRVPPIFNPFRAVALPSPPIPLHPAPKHLPRVSRLFLKRPSSPDRLQRAHSLHDIYSQHQPPTTTTTTTGYLTDTTFSQDNINGPHHLRHHLLLRRVRTPRPPHRLLPRLLPFRAQHTRSLRHTPPPQPPRPALPPRCPRAPARPHRKLASARQVRPQRRACRRVDRRAGRPAAGLVPVYGAGAGVRGVWFALFGFGDSVGTGWESKVRVPGMGGWGGG